MPPRKNKLPLPKQAEDAKHSEKATVVLTQSTKSPFVVPMPPPPLPLASNSMSKGKERATEDGIWANTYEPTTEQELAVHKKKVDVVRKWLSDAFGTSNQKKYRRLLVLSGPAGSGKTATVRVLSHEMNFNIIEWQNGFDDVYSEEDYESLSQKFQSFMHRASDMKPLAATGSISKSQASRDQIILLEDLPNLLHGPTLHAFQRCLTENIQRSTTPIVLIISEAIARGEHKDEEGWPGRQSSAMDVRTILPAALLHGPYVTRIDFNPVAATYMRKGLNWAIDRHFGSSSKSKPSKALVEEVIDSSKGDLRSALMALQFSLLSPSSERNRKGVTSLQIVSRRDNALALFHLLGKLLYNKRVGDPINDSLSKADQERERKLDQLVFPPPRLPDHLSQYQRAGSRINIDKIYSDSPVDTSLLTLYLHQNYYQFCIEVEQCDSIIDALSQIDSFGDTWDNRSQVNSEKFQILARSTLLSLPSPVPRKGQRMYKPDYFENLRRAQQANDALVEVQDWLRQQGCVWSSEGVRLWLPPVLKHATKADSLSALPTQHKLFSSLPWIRNTVLSATTLDENDDNVEPATAMDADKSTHKLSELHEVVPKADDKFWLDEDDIDEF